MSIQQSRFYFSQKLFILIMFVIVLLGCIKCCAAPPEKFQPNYVVLVFTADWCPSCKILKQSFATPSVGPLVKSQYRNNLHFINIDSPENAKYIEDYQVTAIPITFILYRVSLTKGIILTSKSGDMSSDALIKFLNNPEHHNNKSMPFPPNNARPPSG